MADEPKQPETADDDDDSSSDDAAEGAVLVGKTIRELSTGEPPLISDIDDACVQGASYDLRLGKEYAARGKRHRLSHRGEVELLPGQFVLLTTREELALPNDVVGHAGLMSAFAQKGIISLFSPQIDPGFQGKLIVPLFNAGHARVRFERDERVFTVEFVKTTEPTTSWLDQPHRKPLTRIPKSALDIETAFSDLSELARTTEDLKTRLTGLRHEFDGFNNGVNRKVANSANLAAWIALGVAMVSLLVAGLQLFDSSGDQTPSNVIVQSGDASPGQPAVTGSADPAPTPRNEAAGK